MNFFMLKLTAAGAAGLALATAASASDHQGTPAAGGSTEAEAPAAPPKTMHEGMIAPGLMMPSMNAANGRKLFGAKGCVVCHSVNGVGGGDASPLDFSTMSAPMMNPFNFAARMWLGAEAMIMMQRDELGGQIELTGDELSDIIAFVHDEEEQKTYSEVDIPPDIRELTGAGHEDGDAQEGDAHDAEESGASQ